MPKQFRLTALTAALFLAVSINLPTQARAGGLFDSGDGGPSWVLGGTLIVSPEYEGSDEYRVIGVPYIFPKFGQASRFLDVRGADDVRFKLLNTKRFSAGPLAGYRFDREEDDGDKLVGLGDVEGGVVVGAFARMMLIEGLYAGVSYHRTVTGDVDGGYLRFGLEYEAPVTSTVTLYGNVGATYADDEYMTAYFGVSAAQSATSVAGLAAFNAESGIKDVNFGLGAKFQLSPRWALDVSGRYSRLIGDAADSPVIETEDQFSGSVKLRYELGAIR